VSSISVNNISHVYNDSQVLSGITFDINNGQFVSIVGASGCGKSTLMKIVGGIVSPTQGTVTVDGSHLLEALKKRSFGFVFQNPVMLPWRTVSENISLPREIVGNKKAGNTETDDKKAGITKADDTKPDDTKSGDATIVNLLAMVGLQDYGSYYPSSLSGGMKQRAALARALSFDPSVLLMDEPFAALDEISRDKLNLELMRIWGQTKKTVIFVTHSIPEAVFLSDKVIILAGKPAAVAAIRDIDLPRPRVLELKRSEQYYEHILWLRSMLKE